MDNQQPETPKTSPLRKVTRGAARLRQRLQKTQRYRYTFEVPEPNETVPAPDAVEHTDVNDDAVPSSVVQTTQANPIQSGFLLTVGVGLALAVYWVLSSNIQLIVWILAALFIALGLDPVVSKIQSWGAPRGVGVLASVLILGGIVALFFSLLVPVAIEQTTEFIRRLPLMIQNIFDSDLFQRLDKEFDLENVAISELNKWISDSRNVTSLAGGIFGVSTVILNTGFSALIILVLTLYFLATLPSIKFWMYRLAPLSKRPRLEYLSEKITSSVGYYVIGQTVVATLNGIVAYIAASIADLPYSALLAFFAGFMAFIPLIGAATGGTIISVLALFTSWQSALIFAAIYFIYLQIEAYLVSPRVMARATAVPGTVAVIAVIAGGSLLGILGALMAIPTAAAVLILIKEVMIPRQDAR